MKVTLRLAVACAALVSQLALAQSPVWKVSNDKGQVYIGGTVHVLGESDYPLAAGFEEAYSKSDTLIFEIDISSSNSPEFQQKLMGAMMLSDGKTMQSVLNAETYARLEKFSTERGLPLANLAPFKPVMAALTLTVMEMQRLGIAGAGVDEFYNNKALTDGKPTGELETIDEQLAYLAGIGEGKEDMMINYTLDDLDLVGKYMAELKAAWRVGDMDKLVPLLVEEMKNVAPDVYASLIVERNNNWMPKIVEMFNDKDVEFVLVGSGHLVGEDGVLHKLEAKGYKIEQLK